MAIQIVDTMRAPAKEPKPEVLKKLYNFRRPVEVKDFLAAHPFLVQLLVEAHDKIGNYFGPQSKVVLEVVTDPEADDDRRLFAFIQTSLLPEEALDRLDRLDNDWWLDAADRGEGKLCLHVEFA
ncbi:MAG: hypothetical protein ONB46_04270 [candidate division KSB1 bacterium]|nr:hypothetical protein [candidate division KSB1 bacterium]MDZ7365165.1 hypothetical protein [candidate division KSB1 bacterium]MDZ7404375.1 hypothetical protein [candidate division KSB1 bacterium]